MALHNMTGSRTINERQVGAAYPDIISARIREWERRANRGNALRGRAEEMRFITHR